MNVRQPKLLMGVLHSFFIKNIFYDIKDLRLFYLHVTTSGFLKVGIESEHMPEMD